MFAGGPEPVYPSVRPITEDDLADPSYTALAPADDKDWLELVRCGGAGEKADTKEQQKQRYATEVEDSVELYPALAKHIFREPDLIVTSSHDYTIRTFDCHNNYSQCQIFEGHFGMVNEVKPYRGTMLLSCADDTTVRLWKRGKEEYGELLSTYYIHHYPMKTVGALPGQRFMCGGLDQVLRIVSIITGNTLMRFTDHQDNGPDDGFMQREGCGAVWTCLHVRENIAATGSDDSTIRFWDIDMGKCLGTYVGHKGYGQDIGPMGKPYKLSREFAAVWKLINVGDDGKSLASCSYDRTITIWDITDLTDVKIVRNWLAADNAIIHIGMVGPDLIASCGADKEMKIWSITGQLLHRVRTERGIPACCLYLKENLLAMAGGDSSIRIIDFEDTPKDCAGPNGWNAHEYIISDIAAIHSSDEDEKLYTKQPIMYCNVKKEAGEKDAQLALDLHRTTLKEALTFSETQYS
jgi:WD40 repeat protein